MTTLSEALTFWLERRDGYLARMRAILADAEHVHEGTEMRNLREYISSCEDRIWCLKSEMSRIPKKSEVTTCQDETAD